MFGFDLEMCMLYLIRLCRFIVHLVSTVKVALEILNQCKSFSCTLCTYPDIGTNLVIEHPPLPTDHGLLLVSYLLILRPEWV